MEERVWYVLEIILQNNLDNEYVSARFIYEELKSKYQMDCDIKTIYSDIKKINIYFETYFHIEEYIKVRRRLGYYIEKEVFTDGELRFIYDTISSSHAISLKEGENLFHKITLFSSSKQLNRISLQDINSNTDLPLFVKLNTIIHAISQKKNILFEYIRPTLNKDGQIEMIKSKNGNYKNYKTTYMVSPYELMMNSGNYYLLAYNSKRPNQLSIYRIDRMNLVRTTKEPFNEIREMFDMEVLKSQAVNMFFSNEIIDLKFMFNPTILGSVLDQFGSIIELKHDNSGQIVANVKNATLSEGLIGWIMMLGNNITILEPISLKEKVVERLKASLDNYKQR